MVSSISGNPLRAAPARPASAPMTLQPDHGVVIPDDASEPFGLGPAPAVLVQARRHLSQLGKGARVNLGGRHLALNPVEEGDIAAFAVAYRQGLHPLAVERHNRLRHHDAGMTQGIQPRQLALYLVTMVVIPAMNA
ncbi:Uncharacterised protein [Ewingella americana]|uniref:Uncharacterized protein n=1 Tax=Ewingella americana TaxID=41202 RepID=A0A377NBN5_9GAMM|nr:Uncharacterised protein [Ewingella americana]